MEQMEEVKTKVTKLCAMWEAEFGTDNNEGHTKKSIKRVEDKVDKLEYIMDGNGELGLTAKTNIMWDVHQSKKAILVQVVGGLVLSGLGAAAGYLFSLGG